MDENPLLTDIRSRSSSLFVKVIHRVIRSMIEHHQLDPQIGSDINKSWTKRLMDSKVGSERILSQAYASRFLESTFHNYIPTRTSSQLHRVENTAPTHHVSSAPFPSSVSAASSYEQEREDRESNIQQYRMMTEQPQIYVPHSELSYPSFFQPVSMPRTEYDTYYNVRNMGDNLSLDYGRASGFQGHIPQAPHMLPSGTQRMQLRMNSAYHPYRSAEPLDSVLQSYPFPVDSQDYFAPAPSHGLDYHTLSSDLFLSRFGTGQFDGHDSSSQSSSNGNNSPSSSASNSDFSSSCYSSDSDGEDNDSSSYSGSSVSSSFSSSLSDGSPEDSSGSESADISTPDRGSSGRLRSSKRSHSESAVGDEESLNSDDDVEEEKIETNNRIICLNQKIPTKTRGKANTRIWRFSFSNGIFHTLIPSTGIELASSTNNNQDFQPLDLIFSDMNATFHVA